MRPAAPSGPSSTGPRSRERSEAPDGTVALEIHVDRRGQRLRDRARRAQLISAVFAGWAALPGLGGSYIVRDAKGNTAIATWPPSCPRPSRFSALLDPLAPAFLDRVRARTRRSGPVVPDSN